MVSLRFTSAFNYACVSDSDYSRMRTRIRKKHDVRSKIDIIAIVGKTSVGRTTGPVRVTIGGLSGVGAGEYLIGLRCGAAARRTRCVRNQRSRMGASGYKTVVDTRLLNRRLP